MAMVNLPYYKNSVIRQPKLELEIVLETETASLKIAQSVTGKKQGTSTVQIELLLLMQLH